MCFRTVAAIVFVLTAGVVASSAFTEFDERVLLTHAFTTSADGWLISGDTGLTLPEVNATGGNPGGNISNVDEALGETWYFHAPASVLEQLRAAERGTLSYDLEQSAAEPGFVDDDVVIVGPAGRLSYRFRSSPGTDWTSFSVRLSASAGWRWNWNRPATQEQIRRVLDTATSLEIRGEYYTGPDVGKLDNVVLKTGVEAEKSMKQLLRRAPALELALATRRTTAGDSDRFGAGRSTRR